MKIDKNVMDALKEATADGKKLCLEKQLDRALYQKVQKTLLALGGKWNAREKAFLFKEDAAEAIGNALKTGEFLDEKKESQFFPTPPALAKKLVEKAGIQPCDICLEPSAGTGNIAKYLPNCDCIEKSPERQKELERKGFNVVHDDFLTFVPQKEYDVIVMNPPFKNNQDIDHVAKAISIAKKAVVAITSQHFLFASDKKSEQFRAELKELRAEIELVPDGAFKESGTNVKTAIVTVRKCINF